MAADSSSLEQEAPQSQEQHDSATAASFGPILGEALWERFRIGLESSPSEPPLFIFDWDDTIFPTTALTAEGHFAVSSVPPPQREAVERVLHLMLQSHNDELQACVDSASKVLAAARAVGHVVIVTNAIQGWVQSTAGRFMPGLLPIVADIPVISARSIYEPQGIADPARWKALCFARIANLIWRDAEPNSRHLISIGDSWHERAAVQEVGCETVSVAYTKSFKFVERPAIHQVSEQLDLCLEFIEHLATFDGVLDLGIQDGVVGQLVLPTVLCPVYDENAANADESGDENLEDADFEEFDSPEDDFPDGGDDSGCDDADADTIDMMEESGDSIAVDCAAQENQHSENEAACQDGNDQAACDFDLAVDGDNSAAPEAFSEANASELASAQVAQRCPAVKAQRLRPLRAIVIVTSRKSRSGVLKWQSPAGWRILQRRTGASSPLPKAEKKLVVAVAKKGGRQWSTPHRSSPLLWGKPRKFARNENLADGFYAQGKW